MSGPDDPRLAAVSRVLFERWDPIGAKAMDPNWPRDEYDGYAAALLQLIVHHASDDVVAEHLAQLEAHWMGTIPSSLEHRLGVAAALREAVSE